MRRTAAVLLLSAAAAAAPLTARGDTLETFAVEADVGDVDASTPEALAKSYARFSDAAGNDVGREFARRFAAAHLDVLERYYAPEAVARQKEAYERYDARPAPRWAVAETAVTAPGRAVALLKRGPVEMRLHLRRAKGAWRIDRIEERQGGGEYTTRDLGLPPRLPIPDAPARPEARRGTPMEAVSSLRDEMGRLYALRRRGQHELYRHYFDFVAAFFGEEAARLAKSTQPEPPRALPVSYDLTEAAAPRAGVARIEALALEEVPDFDGKQSAIGHAAYDLVRGESGWRVVAESTRPSPEGPFVEQKEAFGLFFLR